MPHSGTHFRGILIKTIGISTENTFLDMLKQLIES